MRRFNSTEPESSSSETKFSVFQKLARLPLVITLVVLFIGWGFFFYWSVHQKFESHIKTGALVARYLKSELSVEIDTCREQNSVIFLKNQDGSDFNLPEWVKIERVKGEESVVGRVMKDQKLIWDHVPISSCRLWPEIFALTLKSTSQSPIKPL